MMVFVKTDIRTGLVDAAGVPIMTVGEAAVAGEDEAVNLIDIVAVSLRKNSSSLQPQNNELTVHAVIPKSRLVMVGAPTTPMQSLLMKRPPSQLLRPRKKKH